MMLSPCHCGNAACGVPEISEAFERNARRPDLLAGLVTAPELLARVYCAGDEECVEYITPDPRHRDNLAGHWRCRAHLNEVPC